MVNEYHVKNNNYNAYALLHVPYNDKFFLMLQ